VVVSEMIVARARWEQLLEKELGDHAARTIREVFHHLGTNLAAFNPILTGYRQVATQLGGEASTRLAFWNDLLDQAHKRLDDMVRGAHRHVVTQAAEWVRADLLEVVRSAFAGFPQLNGKLRVTDPTAPAVEMDMDRPRLEAALVQLFNNAQSCHPDPAQSRVTVTVIPIVRSGRPWVRVAVADNGPGVAPDIQDRVFDPFFSQRPTGSRGHGFGLFFVRRVAQEHGGSVRLDPDYPHGACFIFELPRDRIAPGGTDPGRAPVTRTQESP
jgi:signal transduction histidine kinase